MSKKQNVVPAIDKTAYNCAHCGVLTTQSWYMLYGNELNSGEIPLVIDADAKIPKGVEKEDNPKEKERMLEFHKNLASCFPFIQWSESYGHSKQTFYNINISSCHHCKQKSIWLHKQLLWPQSSMEVQEPNEDLPDEIKEDYREAASILNNSPRGSAALLRLCVQKLCIHLGGKGRKIDDDIALLVQEGLDKRIQQALDIVRVTGNNAIHPGSIFLKDDRETAVKLFELLNLIADTLISQPKHIEQMFSDLPEGAKNAIQRRDNK